MAHRVCLLAICVVVGLSLPDPTLSISLQNADFESTNYHGNWDHVGCSLSSSNDSYHGNHSVHVYHRHNIRSSVSQHVNMSANTNYKIIIYVKLLSNVNNSMYQPVTLMVNCKHSNGRNFYRSFGSSPHVQHGQWYAVGGVNKLPAGSHGCRMFVQTAAPTEFLADYATIQEVTLDSNWKSAANQRIDQLRKADVSIKLNGSNIDNLDVNVEIIQQKHEFAFGSAIETGIFLHPSYQPYQRAFYDLFEWGVLENALRWYAIEPRQGLSFYQYNLQAIQELHSHGVKIRGRNVFWGVDQWIQEWVQALNETELNTTMQARIQSVIGKTKGMLDHWDVNNENLHGDFYEQHTGNPDITMDMFRQVHALDSKPKLFLNEYNIISSCEKAVALMDKARRYKTAGVPIGGIGVQGHMKHIDLAEIWERLNILGEAGLPIFITELGISIADENTKATQLENLLTMFFSHPSVEGVIFWGFWDGSIYSSHMARDVDAALFTGANVTPNAAGRKLQDLLKTQWRTHTNGTIHGHQTWNTRAFKGSYQLIVTHNGQTIRTEHFDLSGDQSLEIHLNGQQNGHPQVSTIIVG